MGKRITIDAAGRLVIPKEIRERHGLKPGYDLEMEDTGTEILLRRAQMGEATYQLDHGFPVFHFPGSGPQDVTDISAEIAADRRDREKHILGE
jgi:AbrB family looped-hinge helix DNA binding protein